MSLRRKFIVLKVKAFGPDEYDPAAIITEVLSLAHELRETVFEKDKHTLSFTNESTCTEFDEQKKSTGYQLVTKIKNALLQMSKEFKSEIDHCDYLLTKFSVASRCVSTSIEINKKNQTHLPRIDKFVNISFSKNVILSPRLEQIKISFTKERKARQKVVSSNYKKVYKNDYLGPKRFKSPEAKLNKSLMQKRQKKFFRSIEPKIC